MALDFDADTWPLVTVVIDGPLSDAELERLLDELDAALERGRHVLVMDLATNVGVDIRHLRRAAAWLMARREVLGDCPPTIFVLSSPFMRAAVSTVYRLSSERSRNHVCESRAVAHTLAASILSSDEVANTA